MCVSFISIIHVVQYIPLSRPHVLGVASTVGETAGGVLFVLFVLFDVDGVKEVAVTVGKSSDGKTLGLWRNILISLVSVGRVVPDERLIETLCESTPGWLLRVAIAVASFKPLRRFCMFCISDLENWYWARPAAAISIEITPLASTPVTVGCPI